MGRSIPLSIRTRTALSIPSRCRRTARFSSVAVFTTLSPNGGGTITRNRIARLNPDGTLDTAFNPNADGIVYSIAVQADGKILVGGFFNTIGGQARNFLARLDPATGLAESFDPNANGQCRCHHRASDGRILLGGAFTSIGGQTRNRIARLDPGTGLADAFNPDARQHPSSPSRSRRTARSWPAGSSRGSAGSSATHRSARCRERNRPILSTRSRTRHVNSQSWCSRTARFWSAVLSRTIGPTDGPAASGKFGQFRNFIARLDPATGLPDSFDPNANNAVFSIAVQPDGKILAGGLFTTLAPNGGPTVTRSRVARLEADGRLDRTLNCNDRRPTDSLVYATAVQPDGKILHRRKLHQRSRRDAQ